MRTLDCGGFLSGSGKFWFFTVGKIRREASEWEVNFPQTKIYIVEALG